MLYRHLVIAAIVLAATLSGCRHRPKLSDEYAPREMSPWQRLFGNGNKSSGPGSGGSGGSGDTVGLTPISPLGSGGPNVTTTNLDDDSLFSEFKIGDKLTAGSEEGERWQTVVYFAYNKSFIGEAEIPKLEKLSDYMKANPGLRVVVEGHCDGRGSEEFNRALGERRALAIRDYLTTLGVAPARVQTISYGEERLAAKGSDEADHALNRRGEFVILGAL